MTLPGRQERQPRWAGLAWALWVLTLLGLAATAWLDALLRQAGQPALAWLGAGNAASAGAAVVAATVGALVASRRLHHPVGWLLVAMGLSVSLSAAGSSAPATGWSGSTPTPTAGTPSNRGCAASTRETRRTRCHGHAIEAPPAKITRWDVRNSLPIASP